MASSRRVTDGCHSGFTTRKTGREVTAVTMALQVAE